MNTPAMQIDWLLGSPLGSTVGLPSVSWGRWLATLTVRRSAATTRVYVSSVTEVRAAEDQDRPDLRAALAGDSEAYRRLVERYQQAIAAYMWRFTRDRLQWEELVHEVFVEAYFSLASYRGDAPWLHWLRRIATRVGYRWWKQCQRRRPHVPLSPEAWQQIAAADPSQTRAEEAAEVVQGLLAQLAPRDRLVLTLMYLEQCSVAEVAQRTGWSLTLVKVQLHRARKRLKRLLEQGGYEP